MNWYRWDGDALIINLRIQPKAKRNEVVGLHGDALKVRIAAPPVDGKANTQLLGFFAQLFNVTATQVSLLCGETSRAKRVRVESPVILPSFMLSTQP